MRSLEWACAKARATRGRIGLSDEDEIPSLADSASTEENMLVADDDDTEDDSDELITPDTSLRLIVGVVSPPKARSSRKSFSTPEFEESPFFEKDTVDAALTLLDFRVRDDDK